MKNLLTKTLTKYYNVLTETKNISYYDDKQISIKISNSTLNVYKVITNFFSPINCLASKPTLTFTTNKVIVHVFYYIPVKNQSLNKNTVNNLGLALSYLLGSAVELRLIKLNYPYLKSDIFAQFIAINTQDYSLSSIRNRIFNSINFVNLKNSSTKSNFTLPSHILGIKINVSGRLITEISRPRQTKQTVQIGSFAKNNLSLVDYGSFTNKNKKGAFTIKVWINQRATVN